MKKIKLLIIGLLITCITPNIVNAATITYGKEDKNTTGVVKIPLNLNVSEEESPFENIKLSCNVVSMDVECGFEKGENTIISGSDSSVIFASTTGDNNFTAGDYLIGYLVLRNKEYSIKETLFSLGTTTANLDKPDEKSITITANKKEVVLSDDATLKSLVVTSGSNKMNMYPEFNKEVYEYTVYGIADTINSVQVKTECNEGNCTITKNGSSSDKVMISRGENKVNVKVISDSNNEEKIYTLTIIRGETSYNSAKLSELTFGEYKITPAFNKNTYEYSLTVPNTVDSLVNEIEYKLEDDKAKVTTSGVDSFVVGENKLTLTIDNVNGDETVTYIINVTRMKNENIEIIKFINEEVTFKDADGVESTLKVEEFKTQYPKYWEQIESGTYKFNHEGFIAKEEENIGLEEPIEKKKNNKAWLIIMLIVIGLIIIIISGILIFSNKKPKKEIKNDKNNSKSADEEKSLNELMEENPTTEIRIIKEDLDKTSEEVLEEESKIKEENASDQEKTVDIDEALTDLMSTKKYNFKDED